MRKKANNNVEGFWFSYIDAIAIFASIFIIYFSITYLKNIKSIQFSNKREEAFKELEALGAKPKPSINEGGWIITIADSILFPHDSVEISESGKKYLKEICNKLKIFTNDIDIRKTIKINIGGHADTTGTEMYNLFLSEYRANNVAAIIQGNIEQINISIIPYGEKRAVHRRNKDNRRITITIQVIAIEHINDNSEVNNEFPYITDEAFKKIKSRNIITSKRLSNNTKEKSVQLEKIDFDKIDFYQKKEKNKQIEAF